MKGFLAVKWHFSLLGYSQKQWAWSENPFKNQTEIKKVMTYLQFQFMAKHICMTKPSERCLGKEVQATILCKTFFQVWIICYINQQVSGYQEKECVQMKCKVKSTLLTFFHFLPVFQFFGSKFQGLKKIF